MQSEIEPDVFPIRREEGIRCAHVQIIACLRLTDPLTSACLSITDLRMAKRISTSEAARNLGDCLARIKHTGESFILHKNDKPVAALGPLPGVRTITFRELWELWRKLPADPKFADDLEAVNRADRPPKNPWVS